MAVETVTAVPAVMAALAKEKGTGEQEVREGKAKELALVSTA